MCWLCAVRSQQVADEQADLRAGSPVADVTASALPPAAPAASGGEKATPPSTRPDAGN